MTFATCSAALVETAATSTVGDSIDGVLFVEDEYSEQPNESSISGDQAMNDTVVTDPRVERLVAGDFDEPADLMGEIQHKLREGDRRLARNLLMVVHRSDFDSDARSLALETIAGARVHLFETAVREAIRSALDSSEPRLQFAAIAAASDLSRLGRIVIGRVVAEIAAAATTDQRVKGAAEAFLRRRV